jgi:arabinogalactan endo-1,4-beta-galactosidase
MPETVDAIYNDPSLSGGVPITWDEEQMAAIDTAVAGTYTVDGTTEDGTTITASVKVTNVNLLQNPSFEDADDTVWDVLYANGNACTDIQNKSSDAMTGDMAFHFYSTSDMEFTVEQTVTGLSSGAYNAVANIQGGDVGDNAEIVLYAIVGETRYESDPVTLDGWQSWQTPTLTDIEVDESGTVTVGMYVKAAAEGWGTIDDFELYARQ